MNRKVAAQGFAAALALAFAGRSLAGTVAQYDVKLPKPKGSKYMPHEGTKQRLKAARRAKRG